MRGLPVIKAALLILLLAMVAVPQSNPISQRSWHWPKGAVVKVYVSAAFHDDLLVLFGAMNAWNDLVPEVSFVYAGPAETLQTCDECLTVFQVPSLKYCGTFEPIGRYNGHVIYGRINLRKLTGAKLFTAFAHELGHSLALPHSNDGLMSARVQKGKVMPSQVEADLARNILNE